MLTAQENFNPFPVPQTDWYSAALPSLPESNGNALRSYRLEALIAIVNAWRRNVKRQLLVLPTGAGKTTVFSQLPYLLEAMGLPEKLLVVAHRTELLEQAIQTLTRYNPGKIIALEQASDQAAPDADIIVASIDTLIPNIS
ncbi:MAG: DEAD/DEAH box helicase family protein [Blastocatellia bacterium]|nr:DEAD/DEAH box helicase family protein [Blastocatellia bacterium]